EVVSVIPREMFGGLALTQSGQVYAWGLGGNASTGNAPASVPHLPGNIAQVSGARQSNFALTTAGQVYSWGISAYTANNGPASGAFPVVGLPPSEDQLSASSAAIPVSETPNGDFVERTYAMPLIPAGEELNVV